MISVTLFSRENCHLCKQTEQDLNSLQDEYPHQLFVVDIDKDPDLIFLDIQLPGESGFDLLNKVDIRGHVVFVTAYDEYAVRAFEVNALDYLLKPVNPKRLEKTIERYLNRKNDSPDIIKKLDYDEVVSSGGVFNLITNAFYRISASGIGNEIFIDGKLIDAKNSVFLEEGRHEIAVYGFFDSVTIRYDYESSFLLNL